MAPSAKDLKVHPGERYLPVTVIADGHLYGENLALTGRDEKWMRQVLGNYRATVAGTWLLTVDRGGNVLWIGKEI